MLSDKYLQVLFNNVAKSDAHLTPGTDANGENRTKSTMNELKSYILRHGLKSGDPLPTEAALCESLKVSRSSVREALRKLEALDIVTVQQGRGSFVGKMSMQPLVETLVLRTALQHHSGDKSLSEVVAIRRAIDLGIAPEIVRKMRGTHNEKMWALVQKMAEKAGAHESYLAEDIEFHSALLQYLDNVLLQQLMSAMWLINQNIIPQLSHGKHEEMKATANAHHKMLAAAEAGDLASYIHAVEEHYAPLEKLIQRNQKQKLP